jgi:hypothetical protein
MQHFIPLSQAVEMTKRYRDNRNRILKAEYEGQNILAICETFNRQGFETLLAKEGCVGIRVYYGMDPELKVHAVIVAINEAGEDILPQSGTLETSGNGDDDILDDALRCPTFCPPPSPLNE